MDTPNPGDISLCAYCGCLTIFADDLTQRPPTAEELAAVQASESWASIERVQEEILRGRPC
jgi:hypothetical protein